MASTLLLRHPTRELYNSVHAHVAGELLPTSPHRPVADDFKRYRRISLQRLDRLEHDLDCLPIHQPSNEDQSYVPFLVAPHRALLPHRKIHAILDKFDDGSLEIGRAHV